MVTLREANESMSPLVSGRFASIMTAESEPPSGIPQRSEMRRPAKGATTHPAQARPGMGYGRPLRPRPDAATPTPFSVQFEAFLRGDVVDLVAADRSSVTSTDSLA